MNMAEQRLAIEPTRGLSYYRVGRLGWDQFDGITRAAPQSALRAFHDNNLVQWYRWSLSFLGLDLRERLEFTLRQLCSNFGVTESRGILLRVAVSHKDLTDLAAAGQAHWLPERVLFSHTKPINSTNPFFGKFPKIR